MSEKPAWLPDLVNFSGDWASYVELIYSHFKTDFIDSSPSFRGQALRLKRHPLSLGREATFWHMTSEGMNEEDRTPDLERCARIRWPRAIIEHESDPLVKVWENNRKGETRINLWFEEQEYLVILAVRKDYLLPWTAYPVTRSHSKVKLLKEFAEYERTQARKKS